MANRSQYARALKYMFDENRGPVAAQRQLAESLNDRVPRLELAIAWLTSSVAELKAQVERLTNVLEGDE